jgi:integrase
LSPPPYFDLAGGRWRIPESKTDSYASLALAAGLNPRWVMGQLGHANARVTLSIYAQVVQRQATDQALIWRLMRFAGEPERARRTGRLAQRMAQRAPIWQMAPRADPD